MKNTKGNTVNPRQVLKTSREKYWFTCDNEKCGKDFLMSPYNITIRNLWCPYCFQRDNDITMIQLRKICKERHMTLEMNPNFDWAPECFFLYENHGPNRVIITNVLKNPTIQDDRSRRRICLKISIVC